MHAAPSHPKDRYRVVACRECRRSKTKCNRVWPCQACVKRGCEDICPDGILIKPKHDKLFDSFPEAADLLQENKRLAARVRELEKAIQATSSPTSSSSQFDAKSTPPDPPSSNDIKPPEEMINAFGTLSIGKFGESNHHNQTASAECLLQDSSVHVGASLGASRNVVALDGVVLPHEITYLAELFPNGHSVRTSPGLRQLILSFLPSLDKALALVDCYYRNLSWMYDPIPREQFMDRIFNRVFLNNACEDVSNIPFDQVALLFIVLAIGVVFDFEQPFEDSPAEPYYVLSLAAFNLGPKLSAPTLASIQSLMLINTYSCMSEKYNAEEIWLLIGINIRMAQSAGLYRDLSSWSSDDAEEIDLRRKLFWELFFYDTWLSFIMGRPAVLANSKQIETKFPQDLYSSRNASGDIEPGFHHWKYKFSKECFVPLLDDIHGAEPPTYQTVLRLDSLIRQFPVPSSLQVQSTGQAAENTNVEASLEMQKYFVVLLKETILLYLHRSYFAHVLSTIPNDPLQSKFAPSFLAAYRSAALLVSRIRQLSTKHSITSRIWTFWSSVFSSAIVLGTVVVRSPASRLSRNALSELDSAVQLLETGLSSPRALRVWTILRNLQRKAHNAYANASVSNAPQETTGQDEEDELALCSGKTRLVLGSSTTDTNGNVQRSSPPSLVNQNAIQSSSNSLSNAYPELVNDIRTVTPFDNLPDWNGAPLQESVVTDFTGYNFGMQASSSQNPENFRTTMVQQTPPAWQNLMSEVGMANVEY